MSILYGHSVCQHVDRCIQIELVRRGRGITDWVPVLLTHGMTLSTCMNVTQLDPLCLPYSIQCIHIYNVHIILSFVCVCALYMYMHACTCI